MNIFTFAKLGRTLMLAAVVAVCLSGCGESEAPEDLLTGDENNINTGGDNGDDNGSWDNDGVVDPKTVVKGTVTDSDLKVYKTVKIGSQTWMAENLNTPTADSWCYGEGAPTWPDYPEDKYVTLTPSQAQANCNKYGRLYTYAAANTACPSGWRLPDREDWDTLLTSVNGDTKKLKAKSGWDNRRDGTSGNGTDNYGFSALPGGFMSDRRLSGEHPTLFVFAGKLGDWWVYSKESGPYPSSAGEYTVNASRGMSYDYDDLSMGGANSTSGQSVRCIKK